MGYNDYTEKAQKLFIKNRPDRPQFEYFLIHRPFHITSHPHHRIFKKTALCSQYFFLAKRVNKIYT